MKVFRRHGIGFLLLLFCNNAYAYVFELYSVKKRRQSASGPEWVIGLGDLHDKKHPDSEQQRNAIFSFINKLPREKVLVLTEDLSCSNKDGINSCGNFYINSRGGLLGGITQECQKHDIDVENHEFRYCRVCSLGPPVNNVAEDPATFSATDSITIDMIRDEVEKEIAAIQQFNDGKKLKKAYKKNIKDVRELLTKLRLMTKDAGSVAQYLNGQCKDADKRDRLIRFLLTFDSELLDGKFTNAVKKATDKEYVFLIAGGSHVKRVCDLLADSGYEYHTQITKQEEKAHDSDRMIPKAIDLLCLDECCSQ